MLVETAEFAHNVLVAFLNILAILLDILPVLLNVLIVLLDVVSVLLDILVHLMQLEVRLVKALVDDALELSNLEVPWCMAENVCDACNLGRGVPDQQTTAM